MSDAYPSETVERAPGKQITLLIADDQAIVRKGIKALLATEPDFVVIGEAEHGADAVAAAQRLKPDVILMDLVMPVLDGIEAIKRIRADLPDARILVLTSFDTDERVFPAIKAGALGYLLKDSEPEDLTRAVRLVARGESSLHPTIARKVLAELRQPAERAPQAPPGETLTEREVAVLRLIAQGLSNAEIAQRLVISEATTRGHVSSILSKLHLASRTQAALYAVRTGLVPLDDSATE